MDMRPKRPASWGDAKRILLVILYEAGGTMLQKTRLFKAFFRAHQEHWKHHDGLLTQHPIVAMPFGPGIDDGDSLLSELESEGLIQILKPKAVLEPFVFTLVDDSRVIASDEEKDSIRRALGWLGHRGATSLSKETHQTCRSWLRAEKEGRFGTEMDVYGDMLEDAEYETMRKSASDRLKQLESVFGSDA